MNHNTIYKNLVRFVIAVGLILAVVNKIKGNREKYYPETIDRILETSFSLDIPVEITTDSIIMWHESLTLEQIISLNN